MVEDAWELPPADVLDQLGLFRRRGRTAFFLNGFEDADGFEVGFGFGFFAARA